MNPVRGEYKGQSYKLFDDYNDIHIFVEDAGFENFYGVLFRKHGIKVENVFSKNGKQAVLAEANSCTDTKCVFLVDRDWDDLLGIMPTLNNIVVLSMHSIECYLITHSSFSGIVISESPKCDVESLLSKKDFEDIVTDISDTFRPLFECFVAIQMCGATQKGCSHNPGYFQQNNRSCAPDKSKIDKFISDSKVTISNSVRGYFSDRNLTQKGHGKYMLHHVWESVRRKSGVGKIGIDNLMIRLGQLTDTQKLADLVSEIKMKAATH